MRRSMGLQSPQTMMGEAVIVSCFGAIWKSSLFETSNRRASRGSFIKEFTLSASLVLGKLSTFLYGFSEALQLSVYPVVRFSTLPGDI